MRRWRGRTLTIESGYKIERPQLAKALALCKKYKATLLIARLDRLARNVHFISGLMETGVIFIACDLPEATPFMLHIYAAAAQEEARAISARTRRRFRLPKLEAFDLAATVRNGLRQQTKPQQASVLRTSVPCLPI